MSGAARLDNARVYGVVKDDHGVFATVKEVIGDLDDKTPRAWIMIDDPDGMFKGFPPQPRLNPVQARRVAKALLKFADEAEAAL